MLLAARQDAVQQVHDDRQQDDQQDRVSDPLERHCGLLSATIAAFAAIPGIAPRITSNCALIALTAGSSGRRCSDSTPSSAPASVASFFEVDSRSDADPDQRAREDRDDHDRQHDAEDDQGGLAHLPPNPSVSAFM